MNADVLKQLTKRFAVAVIRLVETLPRDETSRIIGYQLIKAVCSTAGNYRAVCRSRSRRDFVNKLGVVEEEADESMFWLEMIIETGKKPANEVHPLWNEARELLAIFTASRKTAKKNQ
ncbi:MAG: four helix bundle protein [Ignavibacteriales bacterium]|nr:four helix bundle protein [Ignavibacteriales bacterium]